MKNIQKCFLIFVIIGVVIVLAIVLKQWNSTREKPSENEISDLTYTYQNTEKSKTDSRPDKDTLRKLDNISDKNITKRSREFSTSEVADSNSFEDKLVESRIYASNLQVGDPEFRDSDRMLYVSDGDEKSDIKTIGKIVYRGDNPEVEKLFNDIQSDDPETRAEAVVHLGFIDEGAFEPIIISFLKTDPVDDVRQKAAVSLETHEGSPYAIHALADSMRDPIEDVRNNVITSLRAIHNSYVQQELTDLLTDGSLDPKAVDDIRILLDRYYLKKDPFANLADN